jgi:hypothetical protein
MVLFQHLRYAPSNSNRSRSLPNTEWSFGGCPQGGNHTRKPGRLYEVICRATHPLVFAWALRPRGLDAFLKPAPRDDNGRDKAFINYAKMIVMGAKRPLL